MNGVRVIACALRGIVRAAPFVPLAVSYAAALS